MKRHPFFYSFDLICMHVSCLLSTHTLITLQSQSFDGKKSHSPAYKAQPRAGFTIYAINLSREIYGDFMFHTYSRQRKTAKEKRPCFVSGRGKSFADDGHNEIDIFSGCSETGRCARPRLPGMVYFL